MSATPGEHAMRFGNPERIAIAQPSGCESTSYPGSTGGKFYRVNNPRALPRIFQIEARRVARPLVKEDAKGIPLVVADPSHEMIQNIGEGVPPVTGFVFTQKKENPLVEVLIRADKIDPEIVQDLHCRRRKPAFRRARLTLHEKDDSVFVDDLLDALLRIHE